MTDEDDVTRISEYFKKYDLEEFLVRMLMELGKQAPHDPLEFMHQYAIDYLNQPSFCKINFKSHVAGIFFRIKFILLESMVKILRLFA